jgi:crotonobetainyl-CoA:carnitine CoA-transferase CaiB-like acyl-CoA transferase
VAGILAALHARERTGRGQVVDVALLDGVLSLMTLPLSRRLAGSMPVDELAGRFACYRVYRCRDGLDVSVGALEPKFWERLCRAMGLEALAKRQWATGAEREETIRAFAEAFARRDRADWLRDLSAEDVCVEPVLELAGAAEAAAHAVELQHAGGSTFHTVATPIRLSATPPAFRRPAPGLGEHTAEVLAEAGFTGREIDALRGEGVLA